jgi:hypothetical protein
MAEKLAAGLRGRQVHVVPDSAYAGGELKGLPAGISWTTRLRKDAALHDLPRTYTAHARCNLAAAVPSWPGSTTAAA